MLEVILEFPKCLKLDAFGFKGPTTHLFWGDPSVPALETKRPPTPEDKK